MTIPERPELLAKIKVSQETYAALSPVDKAMAEVEQRRSFVRGLLDVEKFADSASVLADETKRLRAELANARTDRDSYKHQLANATGAFGEYYRKHFKEIVDRLAKSSDDPQMSADLLEERWNYESSCDVLRAELTAASVRIARLQVALQDAACTCEETAARKCSLIQASPSVECPCYRAARNIERDKS